MKKITLLLLTLTTSVLINAQAFDFKTAGTNLGWEAQTPADVTISHVAEGMQLDYIGDVNGKDIIIQIRPDKGVAIEANLDADTNKYLVVTLINNASSVADWKIAHAKGSIAKNNLTNAYGNGSNGIPNTAGTETKTAVFDISTGSGGSSKNFVNFGPDNDHDIFRIQFRGVGGAKVTTGGTIIIEKIEFVATHPTLSIKNHDLDGAILSVYPNPVQSILTVKAKLEVNRLDVYNVLGKRVASSEKSNTINVENLAKGLYFVEIATEKGIGSRKFIKN